MALGCEVRNNDGKCSGKNMRTSGERRLGKGKKKEVKKQNQRKADRDRGFKSFFYYYSFYVKRHSASNGADRNPIGHVVLEVNMVIVYI